MLNLKYLSVYELSKILKVHYKTLNGWLCHYSLAKYVKYTCRLDGKLECSLAISKRSLLALKKYLKSKRHSYMSNFENVFGEFLKR